MGRPTLCAPPTLGLKRIATVPDPKPQSRSFTRQICTADETHRPCPTGTLYLATGLLPAAAQFVFHAWLIESPRWLATQGGADSEDAAAAALAKLRGGDADDEAVRQELASFAPSNPFPVKRLSKHGQVGGGGGGGSGGFSLFSRDVAQRKALLICGVCALIQQCSGINNAFNFSSTFLVTRALHSIPRSTRAVALELWHICCGIPHVLWLPRRCGRCPPRRVSLPCARQAANGIAASTVTLIAVLMNVGNVGVTLLSAN